MFFTGFFKGNFLGANLLADQGVHSLSRTYDGVNRKTFHAEAVIIIVGEFLGIPVDITTSILLQLEDLLNEIHGYHTGFVDSFVLR
jgi:hypothetical protein